MDFCRNKESVALPTEIKKISPNGKWWPIKVEPVHVKYVGEGLDG